MGEHHVKLNIDENGLVTSVGDYTTQKNGESFDNCVICGKQTEYKTNTHIDMRHGYVEGVGQLCSNCYSAGSSSSRQMITIPKDLVERYPNNMQLGEALRRYYWEIYG
jgi:hypothetical protein